MTALDIIPEVTCPPTDLWSDEPPRAHLGSDKQSLEQEIKDIKKQIALLTHD
ncbi:MULTISPECIES: hypothetical protein [Microcystis]|jgi:hypothetical protein|uniref:Uncharacterized protein n=1 Tax=Microcystis aeruginosa FD4 TaxID=2686288 RepID=A0A857D875_MICAE|nr:MULTISPECIES: hypothetical protein [Microcystis]MCA2685848.1 hypothetical protein [Microcystis sp. M046S2]MCA2707412.1 hypothetical protein [Microcystis sp. M038S2]MCA2948326.1 hypothetical protein [Microcystis sp. M109S1]MCA2951501.1 hypothetical protein [Microcystis sp. M112S1]QGZ91752.1 hypothetical protein GQR42_21735 [Microcystis aeruginosa FD4]